MGELVQGVFVVAGGAAVEVAAYVGAAELDEFVEGVEAVDEGGVDLGGVEELGGVGAGDVDAGEGFDRGA